MLLVASNLRYGLVPGQEIRTVTRDVMDSEGGMIHNRHSILRMRHYN
jgi:hypothetical protein